MVKVSDYGGHVMSSSPASLKTRRVGEQCTLNFSRTQTSSRWCGVEVRRGGTSSENEINTICPDIRIGEDDLPVLTRNHLDTFTKGTVFGKFEEYCAGIDKSRVSIAWKAFQMIGIVVTKSGSGRLRKTMARDGLYIIPEYRAPQKLLENEDIPKMV
ncbi:hypothetical protein TNCV_14551 [Trichonephila clavipes]|nr:hypothetical protein TNCV_14551 [Trichonephila clavipes]